jgi:rubrerythrin
MSKKMKMEQNQEQLLSTSTDKDIFYDIHESLTGDNCPVCGYPIVIEEGLEVCYSCGWYKGCEEGNDTNI